MPKVIWKLMHFRKLHHTFETTPLACPAQSLVGGQRGNVFLVEAQGSMGLGTWRDPTGEFHTRFQGSFRARFEGTSSKIIIPVMLEMLLKI